MSTLAVWSFMPQESVLQRYGDGVVLDYPVPAASFLHAPSSAVSIMLTLGYAYVGSAEVRSMTAFYRARKGAYEPFRIIDPVAYPASLGMDPGSIDTMVVRFVDPWRVSDMGDGRFDCGPVRLRVLAHSASGIYGWGEEPWGWGELGWGE